MSQSALHVHVHRHVTFGYTCTYIYILYTTDMPTFGPTCRHVPLDLTCTCTCIYCKTNTSHCGTHLYGHATFVPTCNKNIYITVT